MITLKDFVKETLTQIVEGVAEFSKEKAETGATTQPKLDSLPTMKDWVQSGLMYAGYGADGGVNYATLIDFDLAVSATDAETAKAGGGIGVVSMFRADGSLEAQTVNGTVSRVRFRLPLQVR